LDEHEAVHKQGPPGASGTEELESAFALRSLPGKLRALSSLHEREQALVAARREALTTAATLLAQHDALARTTEVDPASNTTSTTPAANAAGSDQTGSDAPPGPALQGETITHLRVLAADREFMAQLEHRIHDEQGLADVYGKWAALLVSQQRTLHHRVLRVLASVVAVVILVFMVDTLIRSFFGRHSFDRKRMQRMRFLLSFGVQAAGALVILFFIFGAPSQMPTIIGLATAGFTVVMKDFIVAFFGWFVLMGRNGVRVGDWVEINGVGGEVVDVGMLRTTLLETGDWAESGRPTGRRVAFMNSYAIEGHFFNFSTVGQWMWEELRIPLPANANAYVTADSIRAIVLEETRQQTAEADAEWAHATRHTGAGGFSAQPTIDLRPGSGIEVIIRYITRIQDRHEVRSRLYSHILAILHGPAEITERALVGSGFHA
jgi:small-conductance mechanosensitive channel